MLFQYYPAPLPARLTVHMILSGDLNLQYVQQFQGHFEQRILPDLSARYFDTYGKHRHRK